MINKSRVILVDDEPIILAGLANWLSRDYKILSFDSAENFLEAFNQSQFDDGIPTCILLDFQMPGMNGIELQKSLKRMHPEFSIIFMSGNAQQADIIEAWRAGAVDFVLKPFTPKQITDVLNKQFYAIKSRLPAQPPSNIQPQINIPITKREAEVLLLLGKGYQQIEVAKILGISIRTVKMYRSFLKHKLELNTMSELGRFCIENEQAIEKIAHSMTL